MFVRTSCTLVYGSWRQRMETRFECGAMIGQSTLVWPKFLCLTKYGWHRIIGVSYWTILLDDVSAKIGWLNPQHLRPKEIRRPRKGGKIATAQTTNVEQPRRLQSHGKVFVYCGFTPSFQYAQSCASRQHHGAEPEDDCEGLSVHLQRIPHTNHISHIEVCRNPHDIDLENKGIASYIYCKHSHDGVGTCKPMFPQWNGFWKEPPENVRYI